MVISQDIIALLQYRIEQEEFSSRVYQAMSVWLEYTGFSGAAKLWKKYSEEELIHAGFAYEYLLNLNIQPVVPQLAKPEVSFRSLPEVVATSLRHEMTVTEQCKILARRSQSEGDFMTLTLAQKYLSEQVEELKKMQHWADRLDLFGPEGTSLRLLDEEMGDF